ncbi:MAG: 6-bladed beta-propeller [Candidatus Aminicenantes bacterium]|nr:6-bladed beta-propeller [Candidatus Aminicenantes bacterium]
MCSNLVKPRAFIGLVTVVFFILLAMVMAEVPAGPAQKTEWKGRVLTEDGVRVAVNPAEPLYGLVKLNLQEELRIGGEGDDRIQFYRVRDIAADPQGNIYVDDMSNGRVQVFDPAGAFLRTIGRSGQGPGEFENPTLVRFGGEKGSIHVMDRYRRVNLFDEKGVFMRSVVFDGHLTSYFPDASGGFVAVITKSSEEDLSSFHTLCRVNAEGKTQAVLAQFPYTLYMEKTGGGILSVSTGFELSLYAAPLPGDALVYGYSGDYELVVLGADGRRLLVVRKDEPRPEFTAEEKKEFRRIPVPKLKPVFFGILTDSEGRIYVQKNQNLSVKRGFGPVATADKEVDVFSRDGYYLCRTALPPNARVIRGDLVYSYFVDEEQGIEYAQRFRIRNYSDLPKK